jgi:TM2 domain-containing membrane protein YozV
MIDNLIELQNRPKSRKLAVIMALLGAITPLAGLHKLYLGQYLWGIIYLLLWSTPIPRIASAIDAVWYLVQDLQDFDRVFNGTKQLENTEISGQQIGNIAQSLRELDRLRQDGLMSEYEFEQKRRQLVDRIN